MFYSNRFLTDFRSVYAGILKAKDVCPQKAELELLDGEPEGEALFEPAGILEVLFQLEEDLNFLTIYTARPAYFGEFAETMYEKNGLVVQLCAKEMLLSGGQTIYGKNPFHCAEKKTEIFLLDFEVDGNCYERLGRGGRHYIPIYKKPWETAENLDIRVPIGYNTVIVKKQQKQEKKPGHDRFEEAFYGKRNIEKEG